MDLFLHYFFVFSIKITQWIHFLVTTPFPKLLPLDALYLNIRKSSLIFSTNFIYLNGWISNSFCLLLSFQICGCVIEKIEMCFRPQSVRLRTKVFSCIYFQHLRTEKSSSIVCQRIVATVKWLTIYYWTLSRALLLSFVVFFSFSLQFYAYRLLSMSVFVHFVFFSTIFCDFRNRKCISCVIMLEFNWYLVGEQHLCAGLKHFVLNHLEQIVCEITSKFILISIRMSAHHVVVCSVFFSINCWTAFVCSTGESWKKHQKWKTTWNASDNRIIKFTNTKHLCVRQRTKCTHKISTLS